jgi:hypothetical protein
MDWVCSKHGIRNSYKMLVGKPEGKTPLVTCTGERILKWIFRKYGVRLWS